MTVVGYVVSLVGKAMSSSMAITTFQDTLAPTYYPAATTSLDPTTIFLVLSSMAVVSFTEQRKKNKTNKTKRKTLEGIKAATRLVI